MKLPKLREEKERYCYLDTPYGILFLSENDEGVNAVRFVSEKKEDHSSGSLYLGKACRQLDEYFKGERKEFDFPLSVQGTDWQKKVWSALVQIPYGQTASYEEIAVKAGNPRACRAVGAADHANPLLIVIPCHRVILKNGSPGGYAAGTAIKKELLLFEEKNR